MKDIIEILDDVAKRVYISLQGQKEFKKEQNGFQIGKCYYFDVDKNNPFKDEIVVIKIIDKTDEYIQYSRVVNVFGYYEESINLDSDSLRRLKDVYINEWNGEYKSYNRKDLK